MIADEDMIEIHQIHLLHCEDIPFIPFLRTHENTYGNTCPAATTEFYSLNQIQISFVVFGAFCAKPSRWKIKKYNNCIVWSPVYIFFLFVSLILPNNLRGQITLRSWMVGCWSRDAMAMRQTFSENINILIVIPEAVAKS